MALLLLLADLGHVAGAGDGTLAMKRNYPVEQVTQGVYVIWGPIALPDKANQGFRSNPGFVVTREFNHGEHGVHGD